MAILNGFLPALTLGPAAIDTAICHAVLLTGLAISFGLMSLSLVGAMDQDRSRGPVRWGLAAGLFATVWLDDQGLLAIVIAGLLAGSLIIFQIGTGLWVRVTVSLLLALAIVATAVLAGFGHVPDGHTISTLICVVLHLLGVAMLFGALIGWTMLAEASDIARRRCRIVGFAALSILTLSGVVQAWITLGTPVNLIGSVYGWGIIVKTALLLAWIVVGQKSSRTRMLSFGLGLTAVVISVLMAVLPLPRDDQPIWPFSWRLSLVTLEEAPDLRIEVIVALAVLAGAAVLIAVGLMFRRVRWACIVVAFIASGFALPHLDLLVVQAYPTSYFTSPTAFSAGSIVAGAALYPGNCASCHGDTGRGDGPSAKGLAIPPTDLTADHLWGHDDGELFWWLAHGIMDGRGVLAMPGSQPPLGTGEIWALIDYIRANNAGIAYGSAGRWPQPIKLPGFDVACGQGQKFPVQDLRGKLVRVVFGPAQASDLVVTSSASGVEVVTVRVGPSQAAEPGCHTADRNVPTAFQKISGLTLGELADTQFLVDQKGWVRHQQNRRQSPSEDSDISLLAALEDICNHPLSEADAHHTHHHNP